MLIRPFLTFMLITLVAACSDAGRNDPPGLTPPMGPTPDVYTGMFPCDNCPGIESTLWLRSDETFFWQQRYLDTSGEPATTAHNFGRWEIVPEGVLVLRGAGPDRRFKPAEPDALLMVTPSASEHRLSSASHSPFADRVRIEGIATVEDGTAVISECRTGLRAPARGADMRRFLRQYRSLGYRGEPVLVELEARFDWSDEGAIRSFAVERFVRMKANGVCHPPRRSA